MAGGAEVNRYRLTLEYDGTNFSGWQKQKDARTVQGDLLKGVTRLFGDAVIDIQGCGRTDGGVHALEYVAHLELAGRLEPETVMAELNDALPKDIAVLGFAETAPRFHARHNCVARSYVYQLKQRKSAFAKRYNWWVREKLALAQMREAAGLLVGMHDFVAFAEKQELKKSTKVLVHSLQVSREEDGLIIRVVASHFLWRMVRRIVGLLVEVGCGRMAAADVAAFIEAPGGRSVRHTAPAAGLFFEKAFYEEKELLRFLEDC